MWYSINNLLSPVGVMFDDCLDQQEQRHIDIKDSIDYDLPVMNDNTAEWECA